MNTNIRTKELLTVFELFFSLFLLAVALIWVRIIVAPQSLNYLRPLAADIIKNATRADSVKLGNLGMELEKNTLLPMFTVEEAVAFDKNSHPIVSIKRIYLSLSILSIFKENIELYHFEIDNPVLSVTAEQINHLFASDSVNDKAPRSPDENLTDLSRGIVSLFSRFSEFKLFAVYNLRIDISDSSGISSFLIPEFTVELNSSDFIPDDVEKLMYRFFNDSSWVKAEMEIDRFPFRQLTKIIPALSAFRDSRILLNGKFLIKLNRQGEADLVGIQITGGKSKLKIANVLDSLPPIKHLNLDAFFTDHLNNFNLEEFSLEFEETRFSLKGKTKRILDRPEGSLTLTVDHLKTNALRSFWPSGAAASTRQWIIEHIQDGEINNLEAELRIEPDPSRGLNLLAKTDFSGLKVNYSPPMHPVTELQGELIFRGDSLRGNISYGKIDSSVLSESKLIIGNLGSDSTYLGLKAALSGPAADIIKIIYSAGVDSFINISRGMSKTNLKIKFPLSPVPPLEKMTMEGVSAIFDAEIPDLAGFALSDLDADARFNNGLLTVDGKLKINGIRAAAAYRYDIFSGKEMHITTNLKLKTKDFHLFSIPDFPFLKGGGKAASTIIIDSAGTHILGNMSLSGVEMDLKRMGYHKEAADTGSISVKLTLPGNGDIIIHQWQLNSPQFLGRGSAFLGSEENREYALYTVDEVRFAQNDYRVKLEIRDSTRYDLKIGGNSINLEPILNYLKIDTTSQPSKEPDESLIPENYRIKINTNLKNVLLKSNVNLSDFHFKALLDSSDFPLMETSAVFNRKNKIEFMLNSGRYRDKLYFRTDDAGVIFMGLGIDKYLKGGEILITGNIAGSDSCEELRGNFKIENIKILKNNMLAELFSLASLEGIGDFLNGKGINFDLIKSNFLLKKGNLSLTNGIVQSDAIGITFQGDYNFLNKKTYLKGTLIPVNFLNGILDNVPILGALVDKGGIFAFKYSISGEINNPDIRVYPLSVITPGFTRNIFELFETNRDSVKNN